MSDIDAVTLERQLRDGKTVLIDVREPEEYAAEHIKGAVLMPMSSFDPAQVVACYGDKPVVFQCLSGGRSSHAADAVAALGRKRPPSLINGIMGWKAAGLPVESGS